ncbi:MAG: ChaN family lipoprotein [Sulfurimonas sp.]|nr:ChaN family lipoprotein [Sulfurimonas sp.]
MKKIFLLLTIVLTSLYAHKCTYVLDIDIDIDKGLLSGKATITSNHPSINLLNTQAKILEIKNATLSVENNIPHLIKKDVTKSVDITFTYSFKPINGEAFLLDSWYPKIDDMCRYETNIKDSDFVNIIEATSVEKTKDGKKYIYDHPLDTLRLIASNKYTINSTVTEDGLELSTYFYPKDSELSQKYFDKSKEYFKLYKELFGFLPFDKFSIVEVPFPAGYSMPTFTLIGQQILDKDFVLNSSLGHEIAHQWLGNYIYTPQVGNWVEGMTTYYADYLYAKKDGRAAEYRKDILMKYNSYVSSTNEIALIEFISKTQESKNAIGYGKAAFFFYMLEKKIGESTFNEGTRKLLEKYPYKVATYKNLREVYEEVSGENLLDFFKTWVYSKGALDFQIANLSLMYIENRYVLEFDIMSNMNSGYIPLSVCSDDECLVSEIDLSKKRQVLELDIEPRKIIIDENYEFFRKLHIDETHPIISKILQGNAIAVIDREDEKKFANMKRVFTNMKYADEITFEEIKNNNLFILGKNNSLLNQISLPFYMEGDAKIELFKNPLNNTRAIGVFDMEKLSRTIFFKLQHLGKYSSVVFENDEIIKKSVKPSQNGIIYIINNDSLVLKPQAKNFNDVLKDIVNNRVVFVGESHTKFSSHLNQLKIIKAMYKNNPNLSIGMEMFQKPYQEYLDAYIAGEIDEKEMVLKTEYFKRWKYDYELYRPIILFAKEKQIPMVALNIDREITKLVVSEGLDALSDEQREHIPNSIDFSNKKYKNYLRLVYSMHQSESFKNFDEFHHAQLIWDESMAKNMVDHLKENQGQTMVVLAGNGHIIHGYGIPDRAKRRGLSDYIITVNLSNPEPGIADYILYPTLIGTKKAKKLGVYLESDDKLKILNIVEKSTAAKAGIKAGDTIVSFNDIALKTKFDLKRELAFVKGSAEIILIRNMQQVKVIAEFPK